MLSLFSASIKSDKDTNANINFKQQKELQIHSCIFICNCISNHGSWKGMWGMAWGRFETVWKEGILVVPWMDRPKNHLKHIFLSFYSGPSFGVLQSTFLGVESGVLNSCCNWCLIRIWRGEFYVCLSGITFGKYCLSAGSLILTLVINTIACFASQLWT